MALVVPTSLVNARAATAAERRAVAGATATTGTPSAANDGQHTRNHQYLHVVAESVGGTSFNLTLWGFDNTSGKWVVIDEFETSGTVTVTTAAPNLYRSAPLLIAGLDRVYAEISAITGATANVWLYANSFD